MMTVDLEDDGIARLTVDGHLWLGTGRFTRPIFSRFEAWLLIRWQTREVNFIWSSAAERCMRAVLVEPVDEEKQLTTTCIPSARNKYYSRALVLRAFGQSLDHSDATMLADGTIAWRLDAFTFDPTSKSVAVEDAVSVADDVLRDSAGAPR